MRHNSNECFQEEAGSMHRRRSKSTQKFPILWNSQNKFYNSTITGCSTSRSFSHKIFLSRGGQWNEVGETYSLWMRFSLIYLRYSISLTAFNEKQTCSWTKNCLCLMSFFFLSWPKNLWKVSLLHFSTCWKNHRTLTQKPWPRMQSCGHPFR